MFTPLQRSSAWRSTGHICYACQRQLLASAKRSSSTAATTISSLRDDVIGILPQDITKTQSTPDQNDNLIKRVRSGRKRRSSATTKISTRRDDVIGTIPRGKANIQTTRDQDELSIRRVRSVRTIPSTTDWYKTQRLKRKTSKTSSVNDATKSNEVSTKDVKSKDSDVPTAHDVPEGEDTKTKKANSEGSEITSADGAIKRKGGSQHVKSKKTNATAASDAVKGKGISSQQVESKESDTLSADDAKEGNGVSPQPIKSKESNSDKKKKPGVKPNSSAGGFGMSKIQRVAKPSSATSQNVFSRIAKHLPTAQTKAKQKQAGPKTKGDAATGEKTAESEHEAEVLAPKEEPAISLEVDTLEITPLKIEGPPVPPLAHGLDRVLFNPGVYLLQDPHSRVFNFDPYLQKIMRVQDFDFNLLKEYKTSSEDTLLRDLAREHNKKYVGSTSSMTGALSHFHFAISYFRPINTNMLSRDFKPDSQQFTEINRAPYSIFLRWKDGAYAIDADKEFDTPNVLMMLGKSMEKLLTSSKDDFERYRKTDPRGVPEEERNAPEAFQFSTMGDLLMRSQLDAKDPRLPGNGTFDLKTRAVLPIRMDAGNFELMLGYELVTMQGQHESYEREYCDMLRSTMLKYMLQARMGFMDGIFLAYHNVERLFGFQYLPINEIDRAMHGQVDRCLGDQEFRLSLHLFNEVLNAATAKFPEQSLRFLFSAEGGAEKDVCPLRVFAEPMDDAEIDRIQSVSKAKIAQYERDVIEIIKDGIDTPQEQTESSIGATPEKSDIKTNIEDKGVSIEEALKPAKAKSSTNDEPQLVKIEADQKRPLWSAQILIENSVNGEVIKRPINLKPSDKWTVNYCFVESQDAELAATWSLYQTARAKRASTLTRNAGEDEEDAGSKRDNYFIANCRMLAQKGRRYRAELDKAEAGQEVVIWTP